MKKLILILLLLTMNSCARFVWPYELISIYEFIQKDGTEFTLSKEEIFSLNKHQIDTLFTNNNSTGIKLINKDCVEQ